MRWLKAAIGIMSVLIVAGIAVIVVTLVNRMSSVPGGNASAAAANAVLDEPTGTRIVGASVGPDRIAVALQGGGPDRVVIVDVRSGHVVGRIGLAR